MLKSEKMSRMTISGHKQNLSDLSNLLDKHQLIHLIDYNNEDEGFKIGSSLNYGAQTSELLVKIRSVIKLLEVSPNPSARPKLVSDLEKEIKEIDDIASQAHKLNDKQRDFDRQIEELSSQLEQVDYFEGIDLDLDLLSGYSSMQVFAGNLPDDSDLSKLNNMKDVEIIQSNDVTVAFASLNSSEEVERLLLDQGFRSIDVPLVSGMPSTVKSQMESNLSKLSSEKEAIDHEVQAISTRHGDWLVACEEHYSALSEKSSLPLKLATTENMFVLDGWVPTTSVSDLQQALQNLDIFYEVGEESAAEPPIKLDNPEIMKPFELFTKLYSTPKHWEFDPTAIIFLTYPLFFGLMVGDAGYGLAYILFGQFIITKFSYSTEIAALGKILRMAGMWTLFFGTFIFAEAFGQTFYIIGNDYLGFTSFVFGEHFGPTFNVPLIDNPHPPWQLPIHKFSPYGAQLMLLSSVVIGFIHVSLGFVLGFINELRHHNLKHALYSKMSFLLILWGGVIALVSVVGLLPEFAKLLGFMVLLIGLTLAVLGEGIVGILEFPTVFSNVISYARIGAIGLSDYGLAFTVNFIAFNLIGLEGIMAIVSISILLIGHLTVFTLGIIGTGINSLRLQYVEFFTKFVQGGGTLYDPFGYNRKYTTENEVQP